MIVIIRRINCFTDTARYMGRVLSVLLRGKKFSILSKTLEGWLPMKLTPVTAQQLDGIARVYLCSLQTTYPGLLPQLWRAARF